MDTDFSLPYGVTDAHENVVIRCGSIFSSQNKAFIISLDFLNQFVYIWKQSSAELENQNFECSNSQGFLFQ